MEDKNRKIVLVSYQPLTVKIEQDFYLGRAIQEGFEVAYWDLTQVYNKGLKLHDSLDRDYIKKFSTFRELEAAIQQSEKETWFILFMTYEHKLVRLMRMFTVYNRQTVFFARGMQPFPLLHEPFLKKLYHKFKFITNFRYVRNFLGNRRALLVKQKGWIKPHDLAFCAGSEGYNTIGIGAGIDARRATLVPVNAIDYDKMMAIRENETRLLDFKYCVFLDIYLPHHPDLKITKVAQVDPGRYYASLNRFFRTVEEQYKVKVVIAAHPKADYTENPFEGRMTIKYKTAELVKDCEFVLTHHSTSVSFGVLFEKPMLFFYESEINRLYKYSYVPLIATFAAVLNCTVYNIDESEQWEVRPVDKEKYTAYKYKYLTSPETAECLTEDIVMRTFKTVKASQNG